PGARSSGVSRRLGGRGVRGDDPWGEQQFPTIGVRDRKGCGLRGGASRGSGAGGSGAGRRQPMTGLTTANRLTLLRMLLMPALVILVLYGHRGWALIVFVLAGITDGLDGVIARRSGQKTQLGAWLDPMADKLLLVTTFIVLTLPSLGLS